MGKLSTRALPTVAAFLLLSTASARRKDESIPHGQVTLSDGSSPQLLVTVERVCKGAIETSVFADSEGRFSLPGGSSDCEVRAYLPGYRSQSVRNGPDLGTLVLKPRGTHDFALRKEQNKQFSSNKIAWKAYLTGLDDAAKGKWRGAEDSFHDATTVFPWNASPRLCLGIMQEREGDPVAAKKSYKEAIRLDDQFVLPYVYAAALEVTRGDWQEAFNDSNKVIEFDPQSFPGALLANAWANLNLHQMDLAEKSTLEGIKLDAEHRFPELEYVLGLLLIDKQEPAGAVEHFKQYLSLDPHGPRAAAARAEIENRQQPNPH